MDVELGQVAGGMFPHFQKIFTVYLLLQMFMFYA